MTLAEFPLSSTTWSFQLELPNCGWAIRSPATVFYYLLNACIEQHTRESEPHQACIVSFNCSTIFPIRALDMQCSKVIFNKSGFIFNICASHCNKIRSICANKFLNQCNTTQTFGVNAAKLRIFCLAL